MVKTLIAHRGLIYELAIRDLRLRYRRPIFGFLWMLIMPLCTAVIYKVLFSDFLRVTAATYPFFIHLITALLPWTYFANSIQGAIGSVLGSRNIIHQISFPKYLLPIATVAANLVSFLPSLAVLLGFLIVFRIPLSGLMLFLPLVILLQTCLVVGLALLVSALQVIYRDMEYIIQIVLMVCFFLTPGVYTLEEVISKASPAFTSLYLCNPLVGILSLYRIVFIGRYLEHAPSQLNLVNTLVIPALASLAVLVLGYYAFRKYESRFSDYLNI